MENNVPNKQNAGLYKSALKPCYDTMVEVNRLKLKLGGLGLYDCYLLADKAEDLIKEIYKKIDALH